VVDLVEVEGMRRGDDDLDVAGDARTVVLDERLPVVVLALLDLRALALALAVAVEGDLEVGALDGRACYARWASAAGRLAARGRLLAGGRLVTRGRLLAGG
jgi:esterase/lipase superfamily enzyme